MSFHTDLMLQLKADLAQLFTLPAEAVYVGDQPQKITRAGLEVWIEPKETERAERSSWIHNYVVHVRLKTKRAGDLAGGEVVESLKTFTERVRVHYDGTRPFIAAVPSLLAVEADESGVENDDSVIDASVRLRFVEV